MPPPTPPQRALEALGFTPLEAAVYVLLVERPASTGYRIAQALGKAAAGIYKALDSPSKKGAVVVNEAGSKAWRAPFEEVAVVDLFPACVELLREDVEAASRRGVLVFAKLYAPAELDARYAVVTPEADRLRAAWPADWLNVVVDAREHLLALLDCERESVHQAVWSSSAYLSVLYHSGITAEIRMDALGGAIGRPTSCSRRWCFPSIVCVMRRWRQAPWGLGCALM